MNRIRARWWMDARWQDKLTGSSVFRCRLNVESDCDCLMWRGRVFQTLGAETRKACEPNDRLWRGTKSSWEEDERVGFGVVWRCVTLTDGTTHDIRWCTLKELDRGDAHRRPGGIVSDRICRVLTVLACHTEGPPFSAITSSDNLRLGIRLGLGLGSVVWLWQYQELFPATTWMTAFRMAALRNGGPEPVLTCRENDQDRDEWRCCTGGRGGEIWLNRVCLENGRLTVSDRCPPVYYWGR